MTVCPVCDQGSLKEERYSDQFKYGKHLVDVDELESYLCDVCNAEPISPTQILRNQIKIADAKRKHARLLTSVEIKEIRSSLSLTQREAAILFGGGANAFSKYERGDVVQSESMDNLLRVTIDSPQALQALMQLKKKAQA